MQQQLDSVFDALQQQFAERHALLAANCRQLHDSTRQVIRNARRYDFRDVEANGLWSFARLVLRFGRLALQSHDLEASLVVSRVLITGLALCGQFADRHESFLFGSPPEQFVELLGVFKSLSPELDVVYGKFCAYWLCESMRRAMTGFTWLMAVYSCAPNLLTSSRTLWDREARAHTVAHIAQNATVHFVKSFWGLAETRLVRHALPRPKAKVRRELFLPRQQQYVIHEQMVLRTPAHCPPLRDVRCRLLSHSDRTCRSVVLHAHGGGFVSQSPDSHELYLGEWAQRLPEAAIVSVDYSLSPEHKYPTALQEMLDVYLWLRSPLATHALGFSVKDIVVCGDSAGGNLALALALVLHQIGRDSVESPKAVLCFYAPLMLQTRASPSRLMTAVDTLLPLGVLLSCLEAYAPNDQSEHFEHFEHISLSDIPEQPPEQWTPNWSLRWKHSLWSLKERLVGEETPLKPWYRQEPLETRLAALNAVTDNPFVSPLLCSDLPSDVALYLVALHFDACLDDSVEMAKKWTGPVVLDVLDELPHGFLNFVMLSEEARRASALCLDRIKQSLV